MGNNLDFYQNKSVLITGGSGYLGSRLAQKLMHLQCKIVLLDIRFDNLKSYDLEIASNVSFIKCDIRNSDKVSEICLLIKPDIIFHFAAVLNRDRSFSNYGLIHDVNYTGTLNLLTGLLSIDYEMFVLASTSEVYGTLNKSPFSEVQLPLPVSPYSLTKLMAEYLIMTFSLQHNKPYSVFRLFNFFGDDMPKSFFTGQLIDCMERNVEFPMTMGEQIRDYLTIDQVCDCCVRLLTTSKINSEIINICSGTGIKIRDLAEKIARERGKLHLLKVGELPYRKNELFELVGDNSKLKSFLNIG